MESLSSLVADTGAAAAIAKRRRGFSETQKPKAQQTSPRARWTLFTSQFRVSTRSERLEQKNSRHVYDALAAPLAQWEKKALLSTRFMDCLFLIYGCESAKGISQTLLRQIML
jgi:hypothetical protein